LQDCSREAHTRSIASIIRAFYWRAQRRGVSLCSGTKSGLDLHDRGWYADICGA
jgi:hypothetical protein